MAFWAANLREAILKITALSLLAVAVLAGCAATLPPLPDGQNRVVDIVNTTDMPLNFYAVNAERRGVFRSRFAEGEVRGNYYRVVNFSDDSGACRFDFYAELADGRRASAPDFDTCRAVSWVVNAGNIQ